MAACPSEEQLARYAAGACADREAARVRGHVEQCADCAHWLADAEANDAILRSVCSVLDAEARDTATAVRRRAPAASDGPDPRVGTTIGTYRIQRVIASGGMGTVYLARQERPQRDVALKVMRAGVASRSALRRFEYESHILARLRHPNIAQVYEAGTAEIGTGNGFSVQQPPSRDREGAGIAGAVPYFVMEYVPDATTLTRYAEQNNLSVRERLELFAHVCDAVHHGHQNGIIHRDLKPANILVDLAGHVKIIDFGVARSTDSDIALTTLETNVGQLVGTLQYMSPEQCDADPHGLDTRSDVYSLGVVLYELLCRCLPYDVTRTTLLEAARVIREDSPARPSTITGRGTGVPPVDRDVETIALKALEKDREHRYRSAAEFAEDIRRYLSHRPIVARPPSTWYQLAKFTRRNKAFVGGVAAVFVVLVAGIVVSTMFALSEEQQRDVAETERDRATDAEKRAQRQAYVASIRAAHFALLANEISTVRRSLDAAPAELRNWEWHYLNAEADQSLNITTLGGSDVRCGSAALSPDTTCVAWGCYDGAVRIWDTLTGQQLHVLRGHEDYVVGVAFSPDGTRVASGSWDNTVRTWDALTGKQLLVLRGHEARVQSVAFSPDGVRLASGARDGTVRIWDAGTGEELAAPQSHRSAVWCVAFSPDGTYLVSGSEDGTVRCWNALTAEELPGAMEHDSAVWRLVFSPDGTRVAAGLEDGTVRVCDMPTGKQPRVLRRHEKHVMCVAFSSDGTRLASGGTDEKVRLWDAFTAEERAVLRGHEGPIYSVAFRPGPDGERIVSASTDGTVRVWSVSFTPGKLAVLRGHAGKVRSVIFCPGRVPRVVSGSADATVRIWDPSTGEQLAVLRGHEDDIVAVAVSPGGTRLASASEDTTVRVWDADTGEQLHVLRGHTGIVPTVAFSPDGMRLASGSSDETVRLWDADTGEPLGVFGHHDSAVKCVAFSSNGAWLASGTTGGTVHVWDRSTGEELPALEAHDRHGVAVECVAFSPDGTYLATGASSGVRVWRVSTRNRVFFDNRPGVSASSVAFSPDGTRLAAGSSDETVRIWDWSSNEEVLVLRGHNSAVNSVAFSLDGTRLASASQDRTVRIWDAVPFRVRYDQRRAIRDAAPEAERIVNDLYERLNDWTSVAQRLRENASLSDPVRHAALNELLRRATAHSER